MIGRSIGFIVVPLSKHLIVMRTLLEEFWIQVLTKYGRSGPVFSDFELRTLNADDLEARILAEWGTTYNTPPDMSILSAQILNDENSDIFLCSIKRIIPILKIRDVRCACVMITGSIMIGLHDKLVLGDFTADESVIRHHIAGLVQVLLPHAEFDVSSSCRLAALQSLAEMSTRDAGYIPMELFKRKMSSDPRGSIRAVAVRACEDRLDEMLAKEINETAGFLARYDTTDAKIFALRLLTKGNELGFMEVPLSLAFEAAMTASNEKQQIAAEKLLWNSAKFEVTKVAECLSAENKLGWRLGRTWPMAWISSVRALVRGNTRVIFLLQNLYPPGVGALLDSTENILHNVSDPDVRSGAFKLLELADCDEIVTNDLEDRYDKLWALMRQEASVEQQMDIVDHMSARNWSQEWQSHSQNLLKIWLQEAGTAEELRVLSGAVRGFYPRQGLDEVDWDIVSCARSLRGLLIEWSLSLSDLSACEILRGLAAEYFTRLTSGLSDSQEVVTVLRGLAQYFYAIPKFGVTTSSQLNGKDLKNIEGDDAPVLATFLDSLNAWRIRPPISLASLDFEP